MKKRKIKSKNNENITKLTKNEIKEIKKKRKQEKLLLKAKKKYGILETKELLKDENNDQKSTESELSKKLSKLSKEQQDALLKLLDR